MFRRLLIILAHLALAGAAYFGAFLVDSDFSLAPNERKLFLQTLPLLLVVRLGVFAYYHLYEGLWRYVSMRDIVTILKAGTLSSAMFLAVILIVFRSDFPYSIIFVDWVL